MYKKYFIIVEEKCNLYFCTRALYGYSVHNQTVYKANFVSNIQSAKRFTSKKAANKLIDMLPPEENFIHVFTTPDASLQIRLANLVVVPITVNYDS
jgi:hypothetical protein